jgi:hypothetical protein
MISRALDIYLNICVHKISLSHAPVHNWLGIFMFSVKLLNEVASAITYYNFWRRLLLSSLARYLKHRYLHKNLTTFLGSTSADYDSMMEVMKVV